MTEKRFIDRFILFTAQGAFSGKSPFAPGTAGTLVAVLLYWPLVRLPLTWYFTACILFVIIAVWSSDEAERLLGRKDDPSIVIDEIAGYLVAMALLPASWEMTLLGFVLFRVLDILKPVPLRKLQDLHGGLGVVADDIGAGVYTNILLHAAVFIKNNY